MSEELKKINRREIWKTICGELNKPQNGRGQVLLVHLYCDWFMNQICCKITNEKLENIERARFSSKREILYKNKVINATLNKDLKIINSIRNELGHKLNPEPEILITLLKEHSNYWAENVMKDLGTYGKIRFVTIPTVSEMLDTYWKCVVKPVLDNISQN